MNSSFLKNYFPVFIISNNIVYMCAHAGVARQFPTRNRDKQDDVNLKREDTPANQKQTGTTTRTTIDAAQDWIICVQKVNVNDVIYLQIFTDEMQSGQIFQWGREKNNTWRRCFYAKVPCCGGARRQSGLWPWKGRQQGCKGDEGRGDIWTAHLSAHLHFSPHIPLPHGRLAAAAGVEAFWKNALSRAPECAGFTMACWDYSIKPTADYWLPL